VVERTIFVVKGKSMDFEIKVSDRFKFIETEGQGPTLLLLHGLFGALSNFEGILTDFGKRYRVVVPILPIYELSLLKASVSGLVEHVHEFVHKMGYEGINLLGNSLGGHIALMYAIDDLHRIRSLTLTGSSGLFESGMGSTFPKRGDYDFIRKKTEETFYRPEVATRELVDEVYDIVNDRAKAIRVVATAKSAIRHNMGDKLHLIRIPTLLIWGKNDGITPPFVAEKFQELLPEASLHFLEACGHAPMMEKPGEFNAILADFLLKVNNLS